MSPEFTAKCQDIAAWSVELQTKSEKVRAEMDAVCQEALGKMSVVEELESEAREILDPDKRDQVIAAIANLKAGLCAVAGAMASVPKAA